MENQVRHGRYPHLSPYLAIISVFSRHQLFCFFRDSVVLADQVQLAQILCTCVSQLDNGDNAVIIQTDEFIFDRLPYRIEAGLFDASDPRSLYIQLVRKRRRAEYPPGLPVVLVFFNKNLLTGRDNVIVLNVCFFHEKK